MNNKVLIITPSIIPGGGPSGYVYNLSVGINELLQQGHLQNFFEFDGSIADKRDDPTLKHKKSSKIRSIITWIITKAGIKPMLSKKIRLTKEKIKYADIVVFHGWQDPYLIKFAKKTGKMTAYMPHSPTIFADEYKMMCELNGQQFSKMKYLMMRDREIQLMSSSDFIVFPSPGARKEYDFMFKEIINKKIILYIKSGVDVNNKNIIKNNKKLNNKENVGVFFIGRYISHKGYDLFCGAADIIRFKYPKINFYSAGYGPMKNNNFNINDLGWRTDIFNVINNADIIVIPNRFAYYDLLPLECAAFGKPLVMTSVGGNADQLNDLPDSIASCDLDIDSLAESILKAYHLLLNNPAWGTGNKICYDEKFTTTAFALRWDEAISKMMSM